MTKDIFYDKSKNQDEKLNSGEIIFLRRIKKPDTFCIGFKL